jgi:hypothetical protein
MSALPDLQTLIAKLLLARIPEDVFDAADYKKQYLEYLKLLHPDVCKIPGAEDAVKALNHFKDSLEAKLRLEDDAGQFFRVDDRTFLFTGDAALLQRSFSHFNWLKRIDNAAASHFQRYLPESMRLEREGLFVRTHERVVPLTGQKLPQKHVTWMLSRMYEWSAWLHQEGYCHAGINPESMFVAPESHGMVCMSFYHLNRMHTTMKTVSGRYLNWYPPGLFDQKISVPYVDLNLIQRTAIYLLGDPSGNGVKLKKDCDPALIDFLIAPHNNAYETFDQYRHLLHNLFGKPLFHHLNI